MNILEVYKKYEQLPNQAEHQINVAAVARVILGHMSLELDKENIIIACLLHDLGNIAKYNFDPQTLAKMPGLVDPAMVPHWEKVKKEFIEKYGNGSHNMTMKMVEELGVSERVKELVDAVGFSEGVNNAASDDFGKKICAYSDMRLKPLGLASLEDRMADLRVRYSGHPEGEVTREQFENAIREIEQQIFTHCDIKPEDITVKELEKVKDQLKTIQIT